MKKRIAFKSRFRWPLLNGIKTCTARTRKMASVGDTFEAFGATFEIVLLERPTLLTIRDKMWVAEGCDSPADFEAIWRSLHPRMGFQPDRKVSVHHFKLVDCKDWESDDA
ncbi:MAG: hypothetical protein V3V32_04655 [Dehalococcoidia bacterium]